MVWESCVCRVARHGDEGSAALSKLRVGKVLEIRAMFGGSDVKHAAHAL